MIIRFILQSRVTLKALTAFWRLYRTNMESTYDKIHYYKIGKSKRLEIICKLRALLAKERKVTLAWIFGSFTRSDSVRDLDLALHADPEMPFKEFLNLNAQIELELGLPVDMMEIKNAPEPLKGKIFGSGILIKGTPVLQQKLQRESI